MADAKASPSLYVLAPGEPPFVIVIASIDVAQVGVTVKTKFVEPVYTPFAFVIVP